MNGEDHKAVKAVLRKMDACYQAEDKAGVLALRSRFLAVAPLAEKADDTDRKYDNLFQDYILWATGMCPNHEAIRKDIQSKFEELLCN